MGKGTFTHIVIELLIMAKSNYTLVKWSKNHLRFRRKEPTTLQSPALDDRARKVAAKRLCLCLENVQVQRLGKLI